MRYTLAFVFIAVIFYSCTDFIADVDTGREWELSSSDNIFLYYRPPGYSAAPSPENTEVLSILNNQEIYYDAIQDSIQRSFIDPVLIYIYNKDEANERIGTNSGGHAISRYLSIYYTYIYDIPPFTDHFGVEDPFLGAHEMVHVITHFLFGSPGTRLMSEGYAVWIDGSYARHSIDTIIKSYLVNKPERILTPDELLSETVDLEYIYYPNAGIFTRFLVHSYGIEKINGLFTVRKDDFKKEFEKQTGVTWETMCLDYNTFLEKL